MQGEHGGGRNNNFGLLRLLLATLVIISHSPEILDGNRSREILTRAFGTISFGDFAVDGFFIISGYLVTKSFLQDPSVFSYLGKRALRIYPGFLVGFWLCVLLVAPFVSGSTRILSVSTLLQEFPNSIGLQEPLVKGVFPGMAYPSLDSPMWTIGFEFKCYILTMCPGVGRHVRAEAACFHPGCDGRSSRDQCVRPHTSRSPLELNGPLCCDLWGRHSLLHLPR